MKDTVSFSKHIYKRQATGSGHTLPFICAVQDNLVSDKRHGIYRFSLLILSLCLVLSVGVVLIMPLLVGGSTSLAEEKTVTYTVDEEKASCKNTEEASASLGFNVALPAFVPEGAELKAMNIVNQKIFEAIYTQKSGGELVFRMAQGTEDPSGIHTDFAYNASFDISGVACMFSGGNKLTLNLAVWICEKYIYSLYLPDGTPYEEMQLLIENMAASTLAESSSAG